MRVKTLALFALSLIFLPLLLGCVTEYKIVEKTKYVGIPIGTALTTEIIAPAPPDRDLFINATTVERTKYLTTYVQDLLATVRKLDDRLTSISELDRKNQIRINKANEEEEARVKAIVDKTIKTVK